MIFIIWMSCNFRALNAVASFFTQMLWRKQQLKPIGLTTIFLLKMAGIQFCKSATNAPRKLFFGKRIFALLALGQVLIERAFTVMQRWDIMTVLNCVQVANMNRNIHQECYRDDCD
ncbi:hypothetical protein RB24_04025 [Herbaspirillum rubrisubalbicans]|uniref:Secreted protein n=1 Tax=Herbaspirillum rubrisubalbicans TaxID=80842 RepID=A0ABX9C7H3_9BURK|nr:hypothetical protein RB24_04025 [Herbaspirillum rubrisubalbicans]